MSIDKLKEQVFQGVEDAYDELKSIKQCLYDNPEVGGTEEKSSAMLIQSLKEHGFDVSAPVLDIKYSFRAEYKGSKPGASIGIMCEYDALPEVGHACGHNIICTMALGAAYGLKAAVDEIGGRVIVYGTPAEECFVSKVDMAEGHVFDEIDVAIMAHPSPVSISSGKTTGIDAVQIEFYGLSSHAGAAPELGKNALDAAVWCYQAIGFEKQYIKDSNIHGIIDNGGTKYSLIPDYASLKFGIRASNGTVMKKANELVKRCAENAANMTGTTVKLHNFEPSNKEMVTNEALSDVFNESYEEITGEVLPHIDSTGSTDMGDVSYVVPAIHPWLGIGYPDTQLHNMNFAVHTIAPEGDKVMKDGGKALALTGLKVLSSPELLEKIKAEHIAWEKSQLCE